MTERIRIGDLSIAAVLHDFIADEAAPGSGVTPETFWNALAVLLDELADENRALLERRDALQAAIDGFARSKPAPTPGEARRFLEEIGYLAPEGPDFVISPANVDPEVALIAGPQLVVPVTIPRYVLNAVNARWGGLYDALYGSDAIPDETGLERTGPYNPARGRKVMDFCADFLDVSAPLATGSHRQAVAYLVETAEGGEGGKRLVMKLADGSTTLLADPAQFVGYLPADGAEPASVLLRRHGLHVELRIDRAHPIGGAHPAGLKDVVLEAAVTTILDMEDSVAVVDAEDKVLAYSVLLGLARGDLTATFEKGGRIVTRGMNADREFLAPHGETGGRPLTLPGRSLLLVRNVGLHMATDAALWKGREIPEGLLDALVTGLIGLRDVGSRSGVPGSRRNSRSGSIYVVKPKLHGPQEVAFACKTFSRVEELLGLPPGCMKIGVMDEERRTTLNLKECVRAASDRIIFINTGFLDRTGDEIHTCMEFGPVLRKNDMRQAPWMLAYEDWNVDVGLACGMAGRGQIGKGMWAKPDRMAEMLATKIGHPRAGANCAWAPSPTAATLHATHYHAVDVAARQAELSGRRRARMDDLLTLPLMGAARPTPAEVQEELDANAQSILGYVVRWVEQGVGCSKIPDLSGVGLMEDRATLRISSQHVANWLRHGLCDRAQVEATFRRMAEKVDEQNVQDPAYRPMCPDLDASMAFRAALELVLDGRAQPCGYTEPILHAWRRAFKAARR